MLLISNTLLMFLSSNYKADNPRYEIVFTISFVLFAVWILCKKSKRILPAMPPGPRGFPLVGSLFSLKPELHSYLASLAGIHGPILKLKLGLKVAVVVTSSEVARQVLKDHDSTFADRDPPSVTRKFNHEHTNIVWSSNGPKWQMLRKVTANGMLGSGAQNLVSGVRAKEIHNTIRYFYKRAGSPINVGEQMFLTILNVITNMLWGGTVQAKEREIVAAEFRQVVEEITAVLGVPDVSDFFPGLAWLDLQGHKRKMEPLLKKLDALFQNIIDRRLKMKENEQQDSKKDFLQFLLEKKEEEGYGKIPLTMDNIKSLLMDMVVGGTATSSNTIEFALAEMMNNPQIMKTAQEELDNIVGKNNRVDESHLQNLEYVNMIMKEVLRLHPSLPLLVPHCASKTCVVSGYTIPKGARIFVNVWAIQRDPLVWENPTEFKPERFLNGDKGDYNGNDFGYFPFGSGRRSCAGIVMAERMVMLSIASLVHSFDWKMVRGTNVDVSEKFGIVLKKKTPLVAIPTPRLSKLLLY